MERNQTMKIEYAALIQNNTAIVPPLNTTANLVLQSSRLPSRNNLFTAAGRCQRAMCHQPAPRE
jgi:hypothetical protein